MNARDVAGEMKNYQSKHLPSTTSLIVVVSLLILTTRVNQLYQAQYIKL